MKLDALGKNIEKLLPRTRTRRERFLFYLRLYTHAINASSSLTKEGAVRIFFHIQIIAQLTARTTDYPEEEFIKRVHSIAQELLRQRQEISRSLRRGAEADPAHTKLMVIENLCVLRLLRLLVE